MTNKNKAFYKAKDWLQYVLTNWEKLIFRFLWRKIISIDYEWDIWCKITAYWYIGHIAIFNVEYFDAKTSDTV